MARKEQRWKAATYEAREGDELMHPKNKSIPFQLEEHFHNISVDQHRYMSAHAQFGFLIASGWISLIGVMGCKLLQWFSIIQYLLHPPLQHIAHHTECPLDKTAWLLFVRLQHIFICRKSCTYSQNLFSNQKLCQSHNRVSL